MVKLRSLFGHEGTEKLQNCNVILKKLLKALELLFCDFADWDGAKLSKILPENIFGSILFQENWVETYFPTVKVISDCRVQTSRLCNAMHSGL